MKPAVLVIVGPTAVGKTDISMKVARELHAEIISADSMQVYQGMDIGTAKPSKTEQSGIPHHLIDVVRPDQDFNVWDYVDLAEKQIHAIRERNKVPLVTGGTGLYVQALIDGFMFPQEGANPEIRKKLTARAEDDHYGLHQELETVDPKAASKLHPNDKRRVIRALEVYYSTGEPISALQRKAAHGETKFDVTMIGLTRDRAKLYDRIEQRIDQMFQQGLVGEVIRLLDRYPNQPTALQALGYKEIALCLNGVITLEEAAYVLKRDTRRYAKRQLSWFRRDQRITWFDVGELDSSSISQNIVKVWRKSGNCLE